MLFSNGPPTECPDYVSSGPNSCYFDTVHTVVWEVYCLNVTAYSSSGSFTSNEHCLDVADIGKHAVILMTRFFNDPISDSVIYA